MSQFREHFRIRIADHRRAIEREFTSSRDFQLDRSEIADKSLLPVTARMADLLRIVAAIYVADRLVTRSRTRSGYWSRKISCRIQVRETSFWKDPTTIDAVTEAVEFVSGDEWQFEFVDDARSEFKSQRTLSGCELFDAPPLVCLYSGGLDSAAGLARRLTDGIDGPVVPVVIRHRSDIARKAYEQLQFMQSHLHTQIYPICTPMLMVSPKKLAGEEEISQRARSVVFIGVGGVVAWAAGASVVELYESGIGAINSPLLASMEGSQATRGTHPKYLALMSHVLSLASGREIKLTLPFAGMTKGEVTRSLAGISDLARSTVSCAHYPIRKIKGGGWKSCGFCPACIFRRVALHSAGIEESGNGYDYDILNSQSCPVDWKHSKSLEAFLNQLDSLAVTDEGRLPSTIAQHLIRTEVVRVEESQQAYVDLYRRYRGEWLRFVKQARLNGCGWANHIDLPGQAA